MMEILTPKSFKKDTSDMYALLGKMSLMDCFFNIHIQNEGKSLKRGKYLYIYIIFIVKKHRIQYKKVILNCKYLLFQEWNQQWEKMENTNVFLIYFCIDCTAKIIFKIITQSPELALNRSKKIKFAVVNKIFI